MTDEQIKRAMQAFTEMYKAGEKMSALIKELGWDKIYDENIDPDGFPFESDFDRMAYISLEACDCPGHDMLRCDEIAARFFREIKAREKQKS